MELLERTEKMLKESCKDQGFVICRLRTKKAPTGRVKKVWYGCVHSGNYRPHRPNFESTRNRNTTSRKMGCPWRATVAMFDSSWTVTIHESSHNHDMATDLAAYPEARTLSLEEKVMVEGLTKAGATPKVITSALRQANPNTNVMPQDINNYKQELRLKYLAGRTPIEALLDSLQECEEKYFMCRDEAGRVTHLYLAPLQSAELVKTFYGVLFVDCTYKTNKFKMPLLHIVGRTPLNTTFSVAFCFMRGETEDDYTWALQCLRHTLGTNAPWVIVTDRDLGLMAALNSVFPNTANLLCRWHVEKNILSYTKKHFQKQEDFDLFMKEWKLLINMNEEEKFDSEWSNMKDKYQSSPLVINYLEGTWLPHKKKLVSAWTNSHLHLGHLVTSRVEGQHSAVKSWIRTVGGDLNDVYSKLKLSIVSQHKYFQKELSRQRQTLLLSCSNSIWSEVTRKVCAFYCYCSYNYSY